MLIRLLILVLKYPGKIPNQLLTLESADIGYGDKAILKAVDLFISPGDRIGLLGKNGAGKSTLVKCLAGEISIFIGRPSRRGGIRYWLLCATSIRAIARGRKSFVAPTAFGPISE
jgi:ATPase components of ABC transporters with duplicated ATPase domains